ncbi:MAG: EAL domain-containing protein [Woeseiaceae bacterium]|nr:EAL domain-containing protein [Woeseiaceae bacterium]
MTRKKIPRYFVLVLSFGAIVGASMLSLFYAQYRWYADDIISASEKGHDAFIRQSFERRMRADLHDIADHIAFEVDTTDPAAVQATLNTIVGRHDSVLALRFVGQRNGILVAGEFPATPADDSVLWLPDSLVLSYPVDRAGTTLGTLEGRFALAEMHAESDAFAGALAEQADRTRKLSYIWVGAGTLLALATLGAAAWLIIREQSRRIRALTAEAQKLHDADFGSPLPTDPPDDLGELAGVFNAMRDRLRATTISRDYVDSILSGMNEAIIITAADGEIKRINRATTLLLGYEESELLGQPIDTLVDPKKSTTLLGDTAPGVPREAFFIASSGESIPVSYTSSVLEGQDGEVADRVFAAQNITERRRAEQRIRYLARIDALTKIPNRMQFQHLLQREIARARRSGNTLCLFYIDIDSFKEINDTFGHLAGDTTLETVAERLARALPDRTLIGRLAGDEFAVIVKDLRPDQDGRAQTDRLARSILDRLADPFFVQGHEVFMTASMGIAYYPADAANVIDLIRNADAALYSAKKSGGNVFAYYLPQMNEAAVERLMTKSRLKRAFERDELLVHYQPKYNLETGEVFGAEALVRWELPDRGLILPSDFIPLAEETNLIIEIGEWVLDKVCEDFRFWQRSVSSPGRVSVNLSLKQLRQPNFISRINSILRGHEVSPTSLELEITETTLMENPERTVRLLDQLYGLGLHLAIDDFGTGYSSLSALQQFPISTLKIDKTFVRDIVTNPDDATIVGTIIQMGRNLNMDVVAEGVETEEQLNFLQSLDCTFVQGLLFGDPMSADNYVELLLAQVEGTDRHRALFA